MVVQKKMMSVRKMIGAKTTTKGVKQGHQKVITQRRPSEGRVNTIQWYSK